MDGVENQLSYLLDTDATLARLRTDYLTVIKLKGANNPDFPPPALVKVFVFYFRPDKYKRHRKKRTNDYKTA